jgi:hypothetical protein
MTFDDALFVYLRFLLVVYVTCEMIHFMWKRFHKS